MQKTPARIIGRAFDCSDGELGGRGRKRLRCLILKGCEPFIRGLQGHRRQFCVLANDRGEVVSTEPALPVQCLTGALAGHQAFRWPKMTFLKFF
jgi:hypothetical protein